MDGWMGGWMDGWTMQIDANCILDLCFMAGTLGW